MYYWILANDSCFAVVLCSVEMSAEIVRDTFLPIVDQLCDHDDRKTFLQPVDTILLNCPVSE